MSSKREASRHSRGPAPVGKLIAPLSREVFRKRGFTQAHILTHWPEIVGPDLSLYSAPDALKFPRPPAGEESPRRITGAVLHVVVEGAAALEIKHLEPQIIERINGFYGYPAVKSLRLVQGVLPPPRMRKARPPLDLTPETESRVEEATSDVEDTGLRRSLARLGREVMGRRRT
ncbi:MAG: DciA family protein [Parvibaculaceae bacterium]|nr:DciA family protein [Parvibaculaceae bacterium]